MIGARMVFAVDAGGLGDNLAYSVLPRLYKQAGAASVWLSRTALNGEPATRNGEIMDLVWRRNPHLDGLTDDPPTTGDTSWSPMGFFRASKSSASPVDTVAIVHGFGPDATHARPELAYHPQARPDFSGRAVCDPSSVSQAFSPPIFAEFIGHLAGWHGIDTEKIVVLASRFGDSPAILPHLPRHRVTDIFEYADIIASAQTVIVSESGGQSLAAAYRTRGTHVLTTTRSYNQRFFLWPDNRYHIIGEMTKGDQEWPELVTDP